MRAYSKALVALGQAHLEERMREYLAARAEGRPAGAPAQGRALSRLRAAYPGEFRRIYEEKLADDRADESPSPHCAE